MIYNRILISFIFPILFGLSGCDKTDNCGYNDKKNIHQTVIKAFEEMDWNYKYNKGESDAPPFFDAECSGDNTEITLRLVVDEEQELYHIIAFTGIHVPEEHSAEVLRIINSLNSSFWCGFFWINDIEHEVCFSLGHNTDGGAVSVKGVMADISTVLLTVDGNSNTITKPLSDN